MIGLITAALDEGLAAFERDDMEGYAWHIGKAGGVAAAVGAFGIRGLSMCDDISHAHESGDSVFMQVILAEALQRLDNPGNAATIMDGNAISWSEYGAALNQAVEAKSNGDRLRYALMIGLVSGLMFNDPGPSHGDQGTILDAITAAYDTESDELLRAGQRRISSGLRHTDPSAFMQGDQYDRWHEERLRMMGWLQNFGLRQDRASDERVAIPGSMKINHAVRQQARQDDDARVYFDRGVSRIGEGDYAGAFADFDRAIEIEPDNAEAHSHRGSARMHMGDIDGAITDFDRVIEIERHNVGAYVSRAISKQNQGDHRGAIADWDRALELKPDDGGWYVNRGMVKEIIGDDHGAIADYAQAIEVEPDYEVGYIARAHINGKQGDYESAIADYDHVIELWPDDAASYGDRGFAKRCTGDYDGAIADYNRALELRPDDVALHIDRGLVKSSAGDHDGAIADFGRARDLAKGRTED